MVSWNAYWAIVWGTGNFNKNHMFAQNEAHKIYTFIDCQCQEGKVNNNNDYCLCILCFRFIKRLVFTPYF